MPLDYAVVQNDYPLLSDFIDRLAIAQVQEFAAHHQGMPFIAFGVLHKYLGSAMKHILTVLDCEDDWRAEQLLKEAE